MNGLALVVLGLVVLYIGVTGRGPQVLAALTGVPHPGSPAGQPGPFRTGYVYPTAPS